jgi:hypothetical protein
MTPTAHETHFNCQQCGATSLVRDDGFNPRCRNDECPSQWWNKIMSVSLLDQIKAAHEIVKITY